MARLISTRLELVVRLGVLCLAGMTALPALAAEGTSASFQDVPEHPRRPDTGPLIVPDYQVPTPVRLQGRTLKTWPAPEADQGVAVDDEFFYAIDNTVIAKYRLDTGALVDRWVGPAGGPVRHINSCFARAGRLWCANSNYSEIPMGSSVEVFNTATLTPVESHSLGLRDEGSLTWFDDVEGGRIAGFAHYETRGGLPFKDSRYSSVIAFDPEWRRTGGWLFPKDVIERMSPHAASGGVLGSDGLLYVLGHDLPELYVLARPVMGPTLLHVATIAIEAHGQAFTWSADGSRTIFAIDGDPGRILQIELPPVTLAPTQGRSFDR